MSGRRKKKKRKGNPRLVEHAINPKNNDVALNIPLSMIRSHRLAWYHEDLGDYSDENLAGLTRHADFANIQWYCDSNLFIAPTGQPVWDALLEKQGRMVLAAPVYQEIKQWVDDPAHNTEMAKRIANAVSDPGKSGIQLNGFDGIGEHGRNLFSYYVYLLGLRKRAFEILSSEFAEIHGRTPTNQDISDYCRNKLGLRAQLVAISGANVKVKENKYHDEQILMLAITDAIFAGQETAFLTKDEGAYEQFYKALWLLDTHYRSMLFAERYAANPDAFQVGGRIVDAERRAFEGEVVLLRRPSDNLVELLPDIFMPVTVHCFYVRDRIFHTEFVVEREMGRMLKIKATTGGLSTDQLGGRNCHISLGALSSEWGPFAAIGHDASTGPAKVPWKVSAVDANLTLFDGERGTQMNDYPTIVVPMRRRLWLGPGA